MSDCTAIARSSDSLRMGSFNLKSKICNLKSNALALAPNQHARHVVRCLAGLGERWIWAMPAGVVGIVPHRASFAVIALAATRAVANNFVRPGQPIFVNVEIDRFRRRRGLADQSSLGSDL